MPRPLAVLPLVWLLGPANVPAADWPQWRGPEATGVSPETGLPTQWTEREGVAWKAALPGLGTSSPIVWGDRVFVTSQVGSATFTPLGGEFEGATPARRSSRTEEVTFVVQAFHRSDGRLLWDHRLPRKGSAPPFHLKHNLASPSPVTDGEAVYAWFGTGQLVAFTTAGALLWKRHLGEDFGPFDIRWGHGSSPVLYGDQLLLLCDHETGGYLVSLDKGTGQKRWKVERGEGARSYTTPLVIRPKSGDELVVNSRRRIDSLDPATGELHWHTGTENRSPVGMPVFDGALIYATRGYFSGPYLAVRPGGRGDVSETHVEWQVPTGAPYVSSLLHYQGLLYMASERGIATAVDPRTGEKVWRKRLGGVFTASPVAGDGKVYLLAESGDTFVVKAGFEGQVLALNPLGERALASPAISGGHIFVRTDHHLIRIGRAP